MKTITANAVFTFGKLENAKMILLEDVTIAPGSYDKKTGLHNIAVPVDEFQNVLAGIGFTYDDHEVVFQEIENPKNIIQSDEATFQGQNEDYIYLSARLYFSTGFQDKIGRDIFQGHKIGGGHVVWSNAVGQWQVKIFKNRNLNASHVPLFQMTENFVNGWYFNLTPMINETEK